MLNLLILAVLLATMLALIALAFSGPSPAKVGARRLSTIRVRHSDSNEAQVEARLRKARSTRRPDTQRFAASVIPNPEQLAIRIGRTGKKWTLNQYVMASAGIMVVVTLFLMIRGFAPLLSILIGSAIGLGLPHMAVGMLINKRVNKFNAYFPDALELLVRGLRSGLPIAETLTVVAQEIPDPVGEEFRMVTERIKIGKTMDQALQETAKRLGTTEFQFFCITLNIQRETGGNLAETLANLANVLRQRAQMKLKIRAMSSESKASAYIIGSLPFGVFGMLSYINPEYMSAFWTPDPAGVFGLSLMQLIGIGGMCWMGIGAFIMSQMISFEI